MAAEKRVCCEQKRTEDSQWQEWDSTGAETHHLGAEMRVGRSATGLRLWQRRNALAVNEGRQRRGWGSVDAKPQHLWVEMRVGRLATWVGLWCERSAFAVNRNAQGTVSDGNETPLMQKRTICELKCARDSQRQDWDFGSGEARSLWTETYRGRSVTGMRLQWRGNALSRSRNARGTVSDGIKTLAAEKCAHCKWGASATGMRVCWRKNAPSVSRNACGTVSDEIETLVGETCARCEQKRTGDGQWREWDSTDAETHHLGAEMRTGQSAMKMRLWRRRSALAVNRNVQRTVSDRDEAPMMRKRTV